LGWKHHVSQSSLALPFQPLLYLLASQTVFSDLPVLWLIKIVYRIAEVSLSDLGMPAIGGSSLSLNDSNPDAPAV